MTLAKESIKPWLLQARADLEAGKAGGQECHRRYWLQQACEKGIKALGILLWAGEPAEDDLFRKHFLHKHSPLQHLKNEFDTHGIPSRALPRLKREIETELGQLDGDGLLRKVDGTTPTTTVGDVSYRYPFQVGDRKVAPCELETIQWDSYQGNAMGVTAAIDRFLRQLENQQRKRGLR